MDTDTPASVCSELTALLEPWFEERATEFKDGPTVAFYGPSTDPCKVRGPHSEGLSCR